MSGFAGGFLQGLGGGMQQRQDREAKERQLSAMEAMGQQRGNVQPGLSLPMDVGPQGAMPAGQGGGGRPRAGTGSGNVGFGRSSGVDPEMERKVIDGLVQRGMAPHLAKGVAANMIAESRLDTGINEIAPLVAGSRGGYGLNQWTGPRRRAIEAEAQRRGVDVSDLDFQLDYTMHELKGPESRAWKSLQGAQTAEEAARIYSEQFLRPGIPHMNNRLAHARRLEAAHSQASAAPTQPAAAPAPQAPAETQTWAQLRKIMTGASQ